MQDKPFFVGNTGNIGNMPYFTGFAAVTFSQLLWVTRVTFWVTGFRLIFFFSGVSCVVTSVTFLFSQGVTASTPLFSMLLPLLPLLPLFFGYIGNGFAIPLPHRTIKCIYPDGFCGIRQTHCFGIFVGVTI